MTTSPRGTRHPIDATAPRVRRAERQAVLDELPELDAALDALAVADRAVATAIDQLVHLAGTGLVEGATGLDLDGWLTLVSGRTRTDRRMLTTTVEVCRRLPQLRAAFVAGELTWAQLRTLVLQVHRLPRDLDLQLDAALAGAITACAGCDPDVLPRTVRWIVADLAPDHDPTATTRDRDVLVLQPRLDGTGGQLYGDLGPVGFAAVDAATDPGPPELVDSRPDTRTQGTRRAARLTELCTSGAGDGRPTVLLRTELDTLLDRTAGRPAQLLTHLTGGAMWVDADTARTLTDRDVDLRLIVTDRGAPVGVGRARRTAPGWLRDAALALHDTCSEPGCTTAARVCDLDHARPWSTGGTTDVANLAPVCATGNHRKETDGWDVTQTPDGRRTWTHRRTGLTTRTAPTTWTPPTHRPDPPRPVARRGRTPRDDTDDGADGDG